MSTAYVRAYDEKEYIVFSSDEEIQVEQDDKELRFSDSKDKVRVPIWSFKDFRIDNEPENINYFENHDLQEEQKRVWRLTLRYMFDVVHYDFEKIPEIYTEREPMSLIIKEPDKERSIQVFINPSLNFIECGWITI